MCTIGNGMNIGYTMIVVVSATGNEGKQKEMIILFRYINRICFSRKRR